MISKLKSKLNSRFQDKDYKEIVRGSSIVFVAKIIATVFGLIFNLVVAKLYGAQSIGILALVNSFLAIALIPSLLGIQTSILRFIPEYIKKSSFFEAVNIYKKSLSIVVFISSLISLFLYLYSDIISGYIFKKPELESIFALAVFFIVIKSITSLNESTIRAFKDVKFFAILSMIAPISNILVLLILGYFITDIFNPIYSVFLVSIILFIVSFIFLRKVIQKNNNEHIKSNETLSIKKIITVSFPMFLTSVMGIVLTQTDIIMLGMYSDTVQVGIYAIVVKLALLTTFVLSSINAIVAPKFSEDYHNGDIEKLKKTVQNSSKFIFYSTLPIVLFLMLFGKFILGIFGDEFVVGYIAMVILLVGQFVNISVGSVGYLMNMTGYQKQYNYIMIVSAIINIVLNYFLIPKYGIEGAAFASMVSIVFWNLYTLLYININLKFYTGYKPF